MVPKKILFCADFSENSEKAMDTAIEYSRAFGADLFILNVVNTRVMRHPALMDLAVYEDAFKTVEETAQKALEAVEERCRKKAPEAKSYSRMGIPANEIVEFAKEESIDLIVMGTHGRTGFSHLLLGSNAETVVRTAPCPVLTVKSQ